MVLYILKTNINTRKRVNSLSRVFGNDSNILDWNVDLEDVDKVLRIEALSHLKENEIINKVRAHGFYCEALPD